MRILSLSLVTAILVVTLLSVDSSQPVTAVSAVTEMQAEQQAQRTGRTSRASIQRSPSRRALKVVSVGAGGGGGPGAECDQLNYMRTQGMIPGQGEDQLESVYQVVQPQATSATISGYVTVMYNQGFICAEPAAPSASAVAVYGADGTELPAAMAESTDELPVVSLPAEAYLYPGYWALAANEGQHATMTGVWVPKIEGPTAVYDGDTMLLAGFGPNERILIAWADFDFETAPQTVLNGGQIVTDDNAILEQVDDKGAVFTISSLAALQVDDQGSLLISWPQEFRQLFVIVGELSPGLVTNWGGAVGPGTLVGGDFVFDYETLAAALEVGGGADSFGPGNRVRNVSAGLITLRRTPGDRNKPAGDVVRRVRVGEEMEIAGTSQVIDDVTWWPVSYVSATGTVVDGWVAESTPDGEQLLGPVP